VCIIIKYVVQDSRGQEVEYWERVYDLGSIYFHSARRHTFIDWHNETGLLFINFITQVCQINKRELNVNTIRLI